MAAALALVSGLLLFGPTLSRRAPGPAPVASAGVAATFVQLASFAAEEHGECSMLGATFDQKFTCRTEEEAAKAAIELLPRVPSILELRSDALAKAGYRFAGLGRCAVPGKGRSAHLIYKPDPAVAPGAPIVSLFVKEDLGDIDLPSNCCLTNKPCDPDALASCMCCVTAWKKDGLIYILVAPPLTPEVRGAFDAPAEERSIL